MNGLCNTVTHSNPWAPKSTWLCNSPVKKNSNNDLCLVLSFFNHLETLVFPGSQLCGHRTSLDCIAALNASTRACLFDCCLKKIRIFMEMNPWFSRWRLTQGLYVLAAHPLPIWWISSFFTTSPLLCLFQEICCDLFSLHPHFLGCC